MPGDDEVEEDSDAEEIRQIKRIFSQKRRTVRAAMKTLGSWRLVRTGDDS